jgi:hypothetical protein
MVISARFPAVAVAAAVALSLAGSAANAVSINVSFNFVPNGTLTANTGDVTTATTITSGAPDTVTAILQNNIGLTTGTNITLTSPTPVTLGSTFTKSFTTTLGSFLESLTVDLVTPGPSSLGIQAAGTITQTAGTGFDPTSVFYSAAYTQNAGSGNQINASFNNATTIFAVPLPAALPLFATGLGALGLLGWRRKRKALAA